MVITGRDEQRGRQIVATLTKDGERARFIRADLACFEDVQRLAAEVEHVDVLVNNGGVGPQGRLTETHRYHRPRKREI